MSHIEESENLLPQKKRKRIRKTDQASKIFECRCGKRYMNYASMHAHIKKKHLNNQQFQNKQNLIQFNINTNFQFNDILSQDNYNQKYIREIVEYLNEIDLPIEEEYDMLTIINRLQDFQERFLLLQRVREIGQQQSYPQNKQKNQKEKQQEQIRGQVFIQNNQLPQNTQRKKVSLENFTIDNAFVQFLQTLFIHKISKKLLYQLIIFFLLWRRFLNKRNQNFLKQNYTAYQNPRDILDSINIFLQRQLIYELQKFEHYDNESWLLLSNNFPLKEQLIKTIYLFSKWLFNKGYSQTLIKRHFCVH